MYTTISKEYHHLVYLPPFCTQMFHFITRNQHATAPVRSHPIILKNLEKNEMNANNSVLKDAV